MWKQATVATILVTGVVAGTYALVHRSVVKSVASDGQTTSPAAAARKWRQEHGYAEGNDHPQRRHRRHGADQPLSQ